MNLNPVKWLSKGVNAALDKVSPVQNAQGQTGQGQGAQQGAGLPVPVSPPAAPVPIPPATPATTNQAGQDDDQGKPATIVQGQFIESSTLQIMTEAARKTDHFRREAENFDDEKAPIGEKSLRVLFSTFCYIVPSALALLIGMAVGDAFTPHGSTLFYAWYAHVLSITLEASLPILGFIVALTFRRAAKDRAQVGLCAVSALVFIALGVGNAVVQIFMVTRNIGALNASDQAAVYFRAGAPLIVDTICSFYLAVTGAKSLRRYLADKRAVIEAVRDIAGINILLEQQQQTAALNQIQAMMDMESKRERAATWNELERIQNKSIVENARRNMQGDDDSGYYRRRRY